MLRLCEDESRDVQQGASDSLNRLTQFLPETLLPRLRYILFKDLQRTVNLPRQHWTNATYRQRYKNSENFKKNLKKIEILKIFW